MVAEVMVSRGSVPLWEDKATYDGAHLIAKSSSSELMRKSEVYYRESARGCQRARVECRWVSQGLTWGALRS